MKKNLKRFALPALLGWFVCAATTAQEAAPPSDQKTKERWTGTLDAMGQKLRLEFHAEKDAEGNYKAFLKSLDQGGVQVPASKYAYENGNLVIDLKIAGASFSGKLNDEQTHATGKWTQGGLDLDLELEKVPVEELGEHIASWQGIMKAGNREFDFQLRVYQKDAKRIAVLDSFSENIGGLDTEFSQEGDQLTFKIPISNAMYQGTLNDAGDKVSGNWTQGGALIPLEFEKIEIAKTRDVTAPKRPQNPKPPYPYDEENVSYPNDDAKNTLDATLTLPQGKGPFPAAILISGSGAQDRDETILGHKPFWVIADYLSRRGIAVLRYDERGVGKSTGSFAGATSEDFAADVAAGVEFLKRQSRIDREKIGLIGHSEGGLVAPMVASTRDDIAFIVLLAGPGVTGEEIVIKQSRDIAQTAGASEVDLDNQQRLLEMTLEAVNQTQGDKTSERINEAIEKFLASLPEETEKSQALPQTARLTLRQMGNPWFRYFLSYDPRPALRQVKCPVLVLNGSMDLQVDADLNLAAIEGALKEGGNPDYEIHKLDGLNHLFQASDTGSPLEYAHLEETFAPAALKLISDWIGSRFGD